MKIKKFFKNSIGLRLSLIFAAVAVTVLSGTAAMAWGPSRATYTIEKPADRVTFNAITNNPNYGDERNFVIARKTTDAANQWKDVVDVDSDGEYFIRMYVHNNAAANLKLVAENVTAKASVPNQSAKEITLQGQISASNSKPATVWDQVVFKSASKNFTVSYVAGSAKYYNNVNPSNGFALPDSIVNNTGAKLGYEQMDGKIPGCFQYSGTVLFKVKVTTQKQASFKVTKQVRKIGETEWKNDVSVKTGEKVEYRIGYDNDGEVAQENVMVRDFLPNNLTYEKGSIVLKNSSNPNGLKINSDNITTSGINIGNYAPGSNAYVAFTATADRDKLVCGLNKLVNRAQVSTKNGSKENTAVVNVQKDCTPQEKKEYCEIPGKGNLKKDDVNCSDKCKIPGLQHLLANDANCAEVPTELPHTGPAEAAMMVIAIMAITGAVAYWFRSREEMKKATAGLATKANDIVDHKAIKTEAKKSEKVEKK